MFVINHSFLTTKDSIGVYVREIDNSVKKVFITCLNTKEMQEVEIYTNDTSVALFENLEPCTTYDFIVDVLIEDKWTKLQTTTFKTLLSNSQLESNYIQPQFKTANIFNSSMPNDVIILNAGDSQNTLEVVFRSKEIEGV